MIRLGASKLYELGVRARHFSYDSGWRKVYKSSCPTISVGNIVCGGSGKTPFTIMLAQQLLAQGKKVAILSRGYRSQAERSLAMMSRGEGALLTPEEGGDEPHLMACHLRGAIVLVGRDRIKAAKWAKELGAEVLLLDDGMQHRRLHRDEEVVMIDGSRPFGALLPRGFFRDIPARLKNATLVVVNRAANEEHFAYLKQEVAKWSLSPVVGCQLKTVSVEPTAEIKGEPVAAFCALGNPDSFFSEVERVGGDLRLMLKLPDHKRIPSKQLEAFAESAKARGVKRILCSEKDWVKLEKQRGFSLPIHYLKCEMEIIYASNQYATWSAKIGSL